MNQLLQQNDDIQENQINNNQDLDQLQQQNEDEDQIQSINQNQQQDENEGLDQVHNDQDLQQIQEESQQNSQKQDENVETKRIKTQGEIETTTQRKDQNRQLETEKQQRIKTTTEKTFKTLEQIYNKGNTYSFLHLRTAQQFDTKIVHDQLNKSHAKQQYTFPKAQRFSKPKQSYCSIQFYDSQIQTQLNKRAAALGYGSKSDFTRRDKYIPGPTDYNIKLQPKPGVKFAYGRDEMLSKGLHGRPNTNPAPNLYQVKDIITTFKYSMGIRTSAKHIYLESTTPAPDRYNIGGFSSKGNCFIGKYKSSGAPVISPSTAQSQRVKRVPGPGTYDPPGDIGDPRNYLPSQYSTRSGFRFGYQERQTQEIKNKQFPGPGTYQLPSEFGDFEYPPSF
ncbi:unnamed protein product [Paramecium pentaurelia]|uniref:Sperm-tail PG-rich repeat protein n=1 Tax=Paramecium pentaurelia TaxID=43138 RepID=A0A8S1S2B7_9CILI|nr:unnamed protein product [Paramecium pentaurelia]